MLENRLFQRLSVGKFTNKKRKLIAANTGLSDIGWLLSHCGSVAPAFPFCRYTTGNAPANRQMRLVSVVTSKPKKKRNRNDCSNLATTDRRKYP